MRIPKEFTHAEFEAFMQRLEDFQNAAPEEWSVWHRDYNEWYLSLELDFLGDAITPEAVEEWVNEYADFNVWPQCIHCETFDEAMHLLDLVEERIESGKPVDSAAILTAVALAEREAVIDVVSSYTDEYTDDLPVEADGSPDWLHNEGPLFRDAWVVTTLGYTSVYASPRDIPHPENESAILFRSLLEYGEVTVELRYAYEAVGIKRNSIEAATVRYHMCTSTSHGEDFSYHNNYFIGGIWLMPTPENLLLLQKAANTTDFGNYYDDPCPVLRKWLDAAREDDPDEYRNWMLDIERDEPGLYRWISELEVYKE